MSLRPPLCWTLALLAAAACSCDEAGTVRTQALVSVPETVSLGEVFVGDRVEAGLAVTATGTGFVRVLSMTADHAALVVDEAGPWPVSVAPGTTREMRLVWLPVHPGAIAARVRVEVELEGPVAFDVDVTGTALELPRCDDENPCTDDRFDRPSRTCVHAPHERTCDDGSACTVGDRCIDAECVGAGLSCKDDSSCTQDLCDPSVGCVHPVDPSVCDDGNPCTAELCTEDGCESEEVGGLFVPCGPVDCTRGYFCSGTSCVERDVRAFSEGVACDDGRSCTLDDRCRSGSCVGVGHGEPRPTIVREADLFGGPRSSLSTNGVLYAFSGPRGVRIAERLAVSGPGSQRLDAKGLIADQVRAVFVRSGLLVTAQEAADGRATVTSWNLADPTAPSAIDRFDVPATAALVDLRAFADGVVLATEDQTVGHVEHTYRRVGATGTFGPRVWIAGAPGNGNVLLFGGSPGTRWSEYDDDGAVVSFAVHWKPSGPAAWPLAVEGRRFVQRRSDTLELVEVVEDPGPIACESPGSCAGLGPVCDAPGADGRFRWAPGGYRTCTDDASCGPAARCVEMLADRYELDQWGGVVGSRDCGRGEPVRVCIGAPRTWARLVASIDLPGVGDARIVDGIVFVQVGNELHAGRFEDLARTRQLQVVARTFASHLGTGPGHLLTEGQIAVPYAVVSDTAPWIAPVTGPGHGHATVLATGEGGRVRLASTTNVGEYDPSTGMFENWRLLEPMTGRTLLLRGVDGGAPINARVEGPSPTSAGRCDGRDVVLIEPGGASEFRACGLSSGIVELDRAGRLWSAPAIHLNTLRWRRYTPAEGDVVAAVERTRDVVGHARGVALRSSETDDTAGFLAFTVRNTSPFLDLDAAAGGPVVTWTSLESRADEVFGDGPMERVLGVEGGLALLASHEYVLWKLPASGGTLLEGQASVVPSSPQWGWPTVASMQNGRAWVTARTEGNSWHLTDLRYDATPSLQEAGVVTLGDAPLDVQDTGEGAVVTVGHRVLLVAPSCTPTEAERTP